MNLFHRLKGYSPGPAVYLFGAVFLFRALVLARLTGSPLLLPARGDMHFYHDWALRILRGELTGGTAFYGLPGYAYLLAFLYKIFGTSPFPAAFLQALLEAGTAVLIYRLTLRIFEPVRTGTDDRTVAASPREREIVALVAGLAWAFFVPAQAYAVILMPAAWLVFVFWFVVWRVVRTDASMVWTETLLLGLLIGVTATGIATILFLLPLVAAAVLVRRQGANALPGKGAVAAVVFLFLGAAAGTAPCWIHNYFVARDPVLLSAHSGVNFWIGNNPEANGYPRFPPGLRSGQAAMLEDSITRAEEAAGRSLKRSEVSRYWSAQARDYIRQNPVRWLRLLALKMRNFWSGFQYDDLSIVTSLREQGVLFPGFYFGLVAALALPGMVLGSLRLPRSRWILTAILLHLAALLPVFVTERYRLAAGPGLLIFAALGLWIFWRGCAVLAWRSAAIYLVLLGASVAFVAQTPRDPSLWALDAYNSGWQALEAGDLSQAEKKLALARAYVPANPETNFALGNLRLAQGDKAGAGAFYVTTLEHDQTHRGALNNLGVMAYEEKNFPAAEVWFRRALLIDARSAKTHFLLARTLEALGQREAARQEARAALDLRPNQPEFRELLSSLEGGL